MFLVKNKLNEWMDLKYPIIFEQISKEFYDEIQSLKADYVSRGLYTSGSYLGAVTLTIEKHLNKATTAVIKEIHNYNTSTGRSASKLQYVEVFEIASDRIEAYFGKLKDNYTQLTKHVSLEIDQNYKFNVMILNSKNLLERSKKEYAFIEANKKMPFDTQIAIENKRIAIIGILIMILLGLFSLKATIDPELSLIDWFKSLK